MKLIDASGRLAVAQKHASTFAMRAFRVRQEAAAATTPDDKAFAGGFAEAATEQAAEAAQRLDDEREKFARVAMSRQAANDEPELGGSRA